MSTDELDEPNVALWQLQDLETTLLDASPDELPELHAKLTALVTDLPQAIQALIDRECKKARLDEIDKVTNEYGSYNDGCGCCMTETLREYVRDDGYSGEIISEWLKQRIAELSKDKEETLND